MKREALRIYQPEVVARSAVSRTEVREAGREMLEARSQEPASARSASAEVASIPGVNTRTFIEPRAGQGDRVHGYSYPGSGHYLTPRTQHKMLVVLTLTSNQQNYLQ